MLRLEYRGGAHPQVKAVIKLAASEGIVYHRQRGEHLVVILKSETVLKLSPEIWRVVDEPEVAAVKRTPKPKRWRGVKFVGQDNKEGAPRYHKKTVFDCGDILPNFKGLPVYWSSRGRTVTLTEALYGIPLGRNGDWGTVQRRKDKIIAYASNHSREDMIRLLASVSRGKPSVWRATAKDFYNPKNRGVAHDYSNYTIGGGLHGRGPHDPTAGGFR